MAVRVEVGEHGNATAVTYFTSGEERFQAAHAVAVAAYSIETPRLLLHSTSPRSPHGLGNHADQVGRYVMVQGAPQVARRFPERMHMHKAPPPEISSKQFYETDERRGFARGFCYAHLVGGCRMGADPERSVVDSDHRVWGTRNVFVADGSVMPTQGSANPALTIMALASRLAQRLAEKRLAGPERSAPAAFPTTAAGARS